MASSSTPSSTTARRAPATSSTPAPRRTSRRSRPSTTSSEQLSGLDTAPFVGHLAAWNYFMTADTPENEELIAAWHDFLGDENRVTNDPMEAHYIGFNMRVNAVEEAGTTEVDAVREAMWGQEFPNLTGGTAVMGTNHHLSKPV